MREHSTAAFQLADGTYVNPLVVTKNTSVEAILDTNGFRVCNPFIVQSFAATHASLTGISVKMRVGMLGGDGSILWAENETDLTSSMVQPATGGTDVETTSQLSISLTELASRYIKLIITVEDVSNDCTLRVLADVAR